MFYKPNLISPNRTQSPVVLHKQSISSVNNVQVGLPQHQPQTYYSKATPIKTLEQSFETIRQGLTIPTQSQLSPEKHKVGSIEIETQILRNDIMFREQKIEALQKALDLANDDRMRLRSALEQKSNSCVNKEREIAKLLATIHQMEHKKNESNIIKDLQYQIDTLKSFISENALDKSTSRQEDVQMLKQRFQTTQEQLRQSINQNESLQQYVTELMKQNKELSQKYSEKCIEFQKLEMQLDQIQILQNEIKGKDDEIEILKNELNCNNSQKETQIFDQQNEIQKFLSQIKQQYLDDSPNRETEDHEASNIGKPIYSFQSTDDIHKTEFQKNIK